MIRKMVSALLTVMLTAGLMVLSAVDLTMVPVARSDSNSMLCPGLMAEMESWIQRAESHRNRAGSVNTYDLAAVAAYNAESNQLDAERNALLPRVNACSAAMKAVTPKDPSSLPVGKPSPTQRLAIDNARKAMPPDYQPRPVRSGNRELVPKSAPERGLYDALRYKNPGEIPKDSRLAGRSAPRPGDPDPAYPGRKIGEMRNGDPEVSPDHIVPLAEMIKLPVFLKLTPDQMFILSRVPLNYQWLSSTANMAKNSGNAARLLPEADRNWVGKQIRVQAETRARLQEIINNLVKANEG